jgi:hypothetical protein
MKAIMVAIAILIAGSARAESAGESAKSMRNAGIALTVVGGALVIASVAPLMSFQQSRCRTSSGEGACIGEGVLNGVGVILVTSGLAMVLVGVPLLAVGETRLRRLSQIALLPTVSRDGAGASLRLTW